MTASQEPRSSLAMSYSLQELRTVATDELVAEHDRHAKNTVIGVDYFLNELARRDVKAQGDRMEVMTRTIRNLTWAIAALTVVNVAVVIVAAYAAPLAQVTVPGGPRRGIRMVCATSVGVDAHRASR